MRARRPVDVVERMLLRISLGLLVAGLLGVACKPSESDYPPMRSAISRADHDRDVFPTDHGLEENPKKDCDLCHGAFDSFLRFDCLPCHTHDEAWAASEHPRVTGYAAESAECFRCHPTGEAAVVDHETLFPIAAGPHAELECEGCHTARPDGYLPVSCRDCHDHAEGLAGPQHTKVAAYRWETAGCLECHPRGETPGRDHEERFPIRSGAHTEQLCVDCHPAATTSRDYEPVDCVACHDHRESLMDERHGGLPGYRWATEGCLECHPRGEGGVVDHDAFFPIGEGTRHAEQRCADCHPETTAAFSCVGCHDHRRELMDEEHSLKPEYAYASAECLRCHPDGEIMSVTRHEPLFPIRRGRHSRYTCEQCHQTPGTYMVFHCIECHTGEHSCRRMDSEHRGRRNYACENVRCYDCHPRGREEDD